jgi:hypothetical protein
MPVTRITAKAQSRDEHGTTLIGCPQFTATVAAVSPRLPEAIDLHSVEVSHV